MDESELSNEYKSILESTQNKLLLYINKQNMHSTIDEEFINIAENRLFRIVTSMFQNKECRILRNVFHLGFECDILITGYQGGCINIECDGTTHNLRRKQKFCNLRDEYFNKNKVLVLRISVADQLNGVTDENLKRSIVSMLRQSKSKL